MLPYQSAFTKYLPLAVVIALVVLIVFFSTNCGGHPQPKPQPQTLTGIFSGQLSGQFVKFNMVVNLTENQDGTFTASVSRADTECWTSSPLPMSGNFMNANRQFFLQDANIPSITVVSTPTADKMSMQVAYNSILPDTAPCKGIQASGILQRM